MPVIVQVRNIKRVVRKGSVFDISLKLGRVNDARASRRVMLDVRKAEKRDVLSYVCTMSGTEVALSRIRFRVTR